MKYLKAIGISILAIVLLIVSQLMADGVSVCFIEMGAPEWLGILLCGILYPVFALLIAKFFMDKLLHEKLSDNGILPFGINLKWVVLAVLLPATVVVSYLLIFPGEYVTSGMSNARAIETVLTGVLYTGIAAGIVEEMVFRGFIFHALEKAWNTKVALIAPSVLFGAVHIIGMDFSLGSCLLVILAGTAVGIMFTLIRIESGSIWCSALVHAMWNIIIIGGVLTISEAPDEYSIATYVLGMKSFAITGGEFGIESSVVALAGYAIVSFLAVLMIRKHRLNPESNNEE
ncbi:MAG: CPBP family intramembrane metalloprotease [Lachnospiraceae bacterium]|nr:CPBP family intramembrane metalloprotease [Lachnospiraceae bacterium]